MKLIGKVGDDYSDVRNDPSAKKLLWPCSGSSAVIPKQIDNIETIIARLRVHDDPGRPEPLVTMSDLDAACAQVEAATRERLEAEFQDQLARQKEELQEKASVILDDILLAHKEAVTRLENSARDLVVMACHRLLDVRVTRTGDMMLTQAICGADQKHYSITLSKTYPGQELLKDLIAKLDDPERIVIAHGPMLDERQIRLSWGSHWTEFDGTRWLDQLDSLVEKALDCPDPTSQTTTFQVPRDQMPRDQMSRKEQQDAAI